MSALDLVTDLLIRYGFQALGAVVILVAGVMVARWSGRIGNGWLERQNTEPPLRVLLVRALRAVVMLFALVLALDKLGFQIAPLVAGIGVAGIGIGFAMQGVLSNLVAGLTIIFTKPFRVGEYVSLLSVHGVVASIDLSSTVLLHDDRSRVVIPNRKIVGEILHNFGAVRQLHLTFTVPASRNLAPALALTAELVRANARVLKDPAPQIGVRDVTEATVKIGAHPWVAVADIGAAESELYRALVEEFCARGLAIGPATREVRVLNGPPAAAAV